MKKRGFTLIELMVSVAIFSIVMTIALGALLAMSESDRKAQTLKSVVNNLNFAMDSMSRSIRTGSFYHCGDASVLPYASSRDCSTPSNTFAHLTAQFSTVIYKLETSNATLCNQPASSVGCITRSLDGGTTFYPITAPEVYITTLSFYVTGAQTQYMQPKVTILMSGTVNVSLTQRSDFNLQTSVTQRLYDQ